MSFRHQEDLYFLPCWTRQRATIKLLSCHSSNESNNHVTTQTVKPENNSKGIFTQAAGRPDWPELKTTNDTPHSYISPWQKKNYEEDRALDLAAFCLEASKGQPGLVSVFLWADMKFHKLINLKSDCLLLCLGFRIIPKRIRVVLFFFPLFFLECLMALSESLCDHGSGGDKTPQTCHWPVWWHIHVGSFSPSVIQIAIQKEITACCAYNRLPGEAKKGKKKE